jgi:membrane-associated protease RseP (regulator of RpoE activity)
MRYQNERERLINMKSHGKGLIVFLVCLLILLLGCHRQPPPPDYASQQSCQSKKAMIGCSFNPNNPQPEILKVAPNTPAEKADLRPGDIIVSINQLPVRTRNDVHEIMSIIITEAPITVVIKRNSEHITKTVVPKIVGELYTFAAINKILMNDKKVHLIIIAGEITNNTGTNPNYSQMEEWKKSMAMRLRSDTEGSLIRSFQISPNFSIVSRETIEKLVQELSVQQSGLVTELIKSGKMLGATHLLVIELNRFRTPDSSTQDVTSRRLIEIETGKTIASESCQYIFW